MTSKLWILCVLLLLAVSVRAQQSVISYQGAIANPAGMPADSGTYSITVSFYTDESGTQPLWQDTFGTFVKNGIFNIALGSSRPLPPPSDIDRPIWVGIRVGNMAESRPLNRLTAVPMAMNVADSAITSAKMATDYVSSISVNGQKVTGQGSNLNIVGADVMYNDVSKSIEITSSATGAGEGRGKGANPMSTTYYAAIWNTVTNVAASIGSFGATNQVLHGDGGIQPTWGSVNLSTDVSGLLGLAYGGTLNIPQWSSSIGIGGNSALDEASTVAGGAYNSSDNICATVGGGFNNRSWGDDAVITGGEANTIGADSVDPNAYHSAISGGGNNTIFGANSAIPGGSSLMLGAFSFGFNGDNDTGTVVVRSESVPRVAHITNLSDTLGGPNFTQVAYFGNVNMMIGNVDNSARQLQLYAPNKSRDYRSDSAYYSSFQAGGQTANINYTLPISAPDSLGWVLGIGGASGTNIQLQWQRMDTGSGGGGIPAWDLIGNWLTSPGTNYLGTNDDSAFEIHVDNFGDSVGGKQRVMRYEPAATSPNIIGGSSFNTIGTLLSAAAILSGGSNAEPNTVSDTFSVVAGGEGNTNDVGASHSIIGGGEGNYIGAGHAVIGGGGYNVATGIYSFVGGGGGYQPTSGGSDAMSMSTPSYETPILLPYNSASAQYTVIGGGGGNSTNITLASVLGGEYNTADGYASAIGGGAYNTTHGTFSTIAGGQNNTVYDSNSTIGGGQSNSIYVNNATIAGGYSNRIKIGSPYAAISGGDSNLIDTASPNATIGGGSDNYIAGTFHIGDEYGTPGPANVISGGDSNSILGQYSSVGGGFGNTISQYVSYASIPGGDSLIAVADAQTVVGQYNYINHEAEFIVGNGFTGHRANVFEASFGGLTTVFGANSTSANSLNPTSYGTTGQDNILYAAGDIKGTASPDTLIAISSLGLDFGDTLHWKRLGAGQYLVKLNITDPHAGGQIHLSTAFWVTATAITNPITPCIIAAVTPLGQGTPINADTFEILLFGPGGSPVDGEVMFHVFGRQ